MAKYDVTSELAETIRTVRIQNHVTAKSVANHIGKSKSYISKLENGEIKTIQEKELSNIFRYILGSDDGYQDFLNNKLERLLDTLEVRYSDEEIKEQLWFYNYDTVLRLIPIPGALIDDINSRLNLLQISSSVICDRINSNEDFPKDKEVEKCPPNEWQARIKNHHVDISFIKMMVSYTDIMGILTKEKTSCNYVTLLSIVYYLLKFEKGFGAQEGKYLLEVAEDYLNHFKFYSLITKYKLSQQAKTQSDYESFMSSFDKTNYDLMNQIIASFKVFSDLDIERTNKYLEVFIDNLKWDNSFMMALIGTSFYDLKCMSFTVKKQMLTEIQAIIQKYKEMPDSQKQLEVYE